jgi:hypothetical protein
MSRESGYRQGFLATQNQPPRWKASRTRVRLSGDVNAQPITAFRSRSDHLVEEPATPGAMLCIPTADDVRRGLKTTDPWESLAGQQSVSLVMPTILPYPSNSPESSYQYVTAETFFLVHFGMPRLALGYGRLHLY